MTGVQRGCRDKSQDNVEAPGSTMLQFRVSLLNEGMLMAICRCILCNSVAYDCSQSALPLTSSHSLPCLLWHNQPKPASTHTLRMVVPFLPSLVSTLPWSQETLAKQKDIRFRHDTRPKCSDCACSLIFRCAAKCSPRKCAISRLMHDFDARS